MSLPGPEALSYTVYVPGAFNPMKDHEPPFVTYVENAGWVLVSSCAGCVKGLAAPLSAEHAILVQLGVLRPSMLCEGCYN